MARIKLTGPDHPIDATFTIGGSKSISNRALIIRALSGNHFDIRNISTSDDTVILNQLLSNPQAVINCGHAGTSLRFLTAFLALQKGEQVITGSDRMLQKPIGPLVDALNHLGANVKYLGKEGYPPLKIGAFDSQKQDSISIEAGVSSQFISALCLIAPHLPKGLKIKLEGSLVSGSYLNMTLDMMAYFGVRHDFNNDEIAIPNQNYQSKDFTVESDWSSAGYLFAITAMHPHAKIKAKYFYQDSFQGDAVLPSIMTQFGVNSRIVDDILFLEWNSRFEPSVSYDFISQPDLFQTVATVAAGKGITLQARGLQTLKIKETDRIAALRTELAKVGVSLIESMDKPNDITYNLSGDCEIDQTEFNDYGDHRMVMAMASLACISPIILNNPEVVSKSYPGFWNDLETMGFKITSV